MTTNSVINSNQVLRTGSNVTFNAVNVAALGTSNLVATDGSSNLSTSVVTGLSPQFSGLTIQSTGLLDPTVKSTTTGSTNTADWQLLRGDQANGFSRIKYGTGGAYDWSSGTRSGSYNFLVYDEFNSVAVLTLAQGSGATSTATFAGSLTCSNDLTVNSGNGIINTAGKTLKIKQGSNACAGTGAVMIAGAVTVNTTAVATGDIILLMKTAAGGTPTTGDPVVTISNGVSFTITGGALDTATWSWFILKAA